MDSRAGLAYRELAPRHQIVRCAVVGARGDGEEREEEPARDRTSAPGPKIALELTQR